MTFSIVEYERQIKSSDKDHRHMGLWNLKEELEKVQGIHFDEFGRKKVLDGILQKLIDPIVSVQGVAIKCLAAIVPRLSQAQVEGCCAVLTERIINGKEETRDISALGLKKVVSELPGKHAVILEAAVVNVFMKKLDNISDDTVRADVLDILNDITKRFGTKLTQRAQVGLYKRFLKDVSSERATVKKRAMAGLASVSVYLNESDFKEMITKVMGGVTENMENVPQLAANIQALAAVARVSGHRLAPYMEGIVDLVIGAYDLVIDMEEEDEHIAGEIREHMMQIVEHLVVKCPQQVKSQIELFMVYCKDFLLYDPNYCYDSTDEEIEVDDGEDEDMSEDEGVVSDDDDASWKIRKAAAKCISAMIKTQPDQLEFYINELCSPEEHVLISRFKEREESVKLDIFNVFCTLLGACIRTKTLVTGETVVEPIGEGAQKLNEMKEAIMYRLKKQIKSKSSKVRIAIFKTLRALMNVLGGVFDEYTNMLIPLALNTLENSDDADNQVKLEALEFLSKYIQTHENCKESVKDIHRVLLKVSNDKFYKVVASAFKTQVVIFPLINDASHQHIHNEIYDNLLNHLKIQDIDQEVKESVIYTTSCFLATLSPVLTLDHTEACNTLYERLSNEITRLVATKAFLRLAQAKLNMNNISSVYGTLTNFLRKLDRPLRQASLRTMIVFVTNYDIPSELNGDALVELNAFLDGSDMHLASLAVQLATTITEKDPQNKKLGDVVDKSIRLLANSTLLEATLKSLCTFLHVVVSLKGFNNLFNDILKVAASDSTKQIFTNVGHALVSITLASSDSDKEATINKFASYIGKSKGFERLLGLYALGEMGREIDMSKTHKKVVDSIRAQFDSPEQDARIAASYAFGNIAIGNLDHFLPVIVNDIQVKEKHRYLLIHSLKEIIVRASATQLANTLDKTVPILVANAGSKEEGIRNVVSECLGRLTLVNYTILMKELIELAEGDSSLAKITVINALRNTSTNSAGNVDVSLTKDLKHFLPLLNKQKQPEIDVRRSVLLLVSSCAQYKAYLIRDALSSILPHIYEECTFDEQYQRIIDLGPFKHKVDDGLELRKSAFECLDILLTNMKDDLEVHGFMKQLIKGVADADGDIVQLTHQMIQRAASVFARPLIGIVPAICPALVKSLTKKIPKKQGLETDKERIRELKKSTLRVVVTLSKLDVDDIDEFTKLINDTINNDAELKKSYENLMNKED